MIKLITFFLVFFSFKLLLAQEPPRRVREYLQRQENDARRIFPSPIKPFDNSTLGFKLQEQFKLQAANSCGIVRPEKDENNMERNYIPPDVFAYYTEEKLRNTRIENINASANNILFFALKDDDIRRIQNSSFSESDYIQANRVIGINDQLVEYGSSYLNSIAGFPSYFFQKSCGSYFSGNLNVNASFPIAELKKSIEAETEKKSMITSISGKFFSPLYLILNESSKKSVYANLLIWRVYLEDDRVSNDKKKLLVNTGKYISEFDATLIQRSTDRNKNLSMSGMIGSRIGLGKFSLDGEIKAGIENKEKFSMEGFSTLIHKNNSGLLMWRLMPLPTVQEINNKLQSSLSLSETGQRTTQGIATHLLPFTLSRVMAGIPLLICNSSWAIDDFDINLWVTRPNVKMIAQINNGDFPDCICEVTGQLKQTAIASAMNEGRQLKIEVTVSNSPDVNNQKLKFTITDPIVKILRGPSLLDIDENIVNANAKLTEGAGKKNFYYPITLFVNDAEVEVKSPLEISELKIEFLNASDTADNFLSVSQGAISAKSLEVLLKSKEVSSEYIKTAERNVPIKIKLRVKLKNGVNETILISNTINIKVPIFGETPKQTNN